MAVWALIADDLSGALDTALQFRKAHLHTVVSTKKGAWPSHGEVVALTTETRHCDPKQARAQVAAAIRSSGFSKECRLYKKTDSLLRGNIGPELEAVVDAAGVDALVYTPAYPTGGRITKNGVHRLWGQPVSEGPPGRDPVAPALESHIPSLRSQTIPLDTVRAGEQSLAEALEAGRRAGVRVLVPDVETDEDLATVAAALDTTGAWSACAGSAGLAEHLARRSAAAAAPPPPARRATTAAAIVGTPNQHTARQITYAERKLEIERIPLLNRSNGASDALRQARPAWRAGRTVAFDAVIPDAHPDSAARDAQRAAITQLARLLEREIADLGLILTGGDTAFAAFEGLGAAAIELHGEVEWGVPWGMAARGATRTIPVVTKGGTMGGEHAIAAAFEQIGASGHTSRRAPSTSGND